MSTNALSELFFYTQPSDNLINYSTSNGIFYSVLVVSYRTSMAVRYLAFYSFRISVIDFLGNNRA